MLLECRVDAARRELGRHRIGAHLKSLSIEEGRESTVGKVYITKMVRIVQAHELHIPIP
jgi:hypothetical protein